MNESDNLIDYEQVTKEYIEWTLHFLRNRERMTSDEIEKFENIYSSVACAMMEYANEKGYSKDELKNALSVGVDIVNERLKYS